MSSSPSDSSDSEVSGTSSEEDWRKIRNLLGVKSSIQGMLPRATVVLHDIFATNTTTSKTVPVNERKEKEKGLNCEPQIQKEAPVSGQKEGDGDKIQGEKEKERRIDEATILKEAPVPGQKNNEEAKNPGEKKKIQWPEDWSDLSSEHSDYAPNLQDVSSSSESEKENNGENEKKVPKTNRFTSKKATKKMAQKQKSQKDPAKAAAVANVLRTKIVANRRNVPEGGGPEVLWPCPDCEYKPKRADHLRRHMINQHKRPQTDPFFKTLFYSNYQICPGCDTAKSNLAEHSKSCPGLKKKKAEEEKLETMRLNKLSTTVSTTEKSSPLQRLGHDPFEDCFFDYMGKKATLTKETYVRQVRGFFRYYAAKSPGFDVQHLFTKLTAAPENAVVFQAHHIRSFSENMTPSMALNMSKAMTMFMLLYKEYVISKYAETNGEVMEWAKANIDHAGTILSSLGKTNAVEARTQLALNREARRAKQMLDSQPKLVRLYCRLFLQSVYVRNLCENVASDCEKMLQDFTVTPHNLRDKLMGLLEISSGGLRGVAIRSLTLGEYEARQIEENPRRVILCCHAHKTAKFYGAAVLIISDPLVVNLLDAYVEYARMLIGDPKHLCLKSSPLFPTKQNKIPCSTRDGINWIRQSLLGLGVKNEADPELKSFTSSAIRKAYAQYANEADESTSKAQEIIRQDAASHMGHTNTTADRHYRVDNLSSIRTAARVSELLNRPISAHEFEELGTTPSVMADPLVVPAPEPCGLSAKSSDSSDEESASSTAASKVGAATKRPSRGNGAQDTPVALKSVKGTAKKPGQIAVPFTHEERALLAHHFLVKGRINITVHTMHKAMYDPNFVTLFRKIEDQTGGNIRRSKHRIRSALRQLETTCPDEEED